MKCEIIETKKYPHIERKEVENDKFCFYYSYINAMMNDRTFSDAN